MTDVNPLLLLDFYKTTHHEQYPKGLTKLVSYFTPRESRIPGTDTLIMFGLQGFIKTYLIQSFDKNFFARPRQAVTDAYARVLDYTLGRGIVDYGKIAALHRLGYLPLQIKALDEGLRVPMRTPMFEVTNTHPDFAWLVNTVESLMSCSLWHAMVAANVGYAYRQLVNRYFDISVDADVPRSRALGDFSMRGQESRESAVTTSAAFCLSFVNTATVPAILYLEENYNCDCALEPVAYGAVSTEHSVMSSNFAADGDEISLVRRLLTEIYPDTSFSMVSDSYDYWNLVENILPQCRAEILSHNGFLGVRGDSGDPVEISVQTVFKLWELFGGTTNSKGYKLLDPHLKVIYGDGITLHRTEEIYKRLIAGGFACDNVLLASGSHSMQVLAAPGVLEPFTRDTFGIAVKSTYGEINGKPIFIYKDPKTDERHIKRSHKGCCAVTARGGGLVCADGLTFREAEAYPDNLLKPVFRDGRMLREQSLREIRNLLHEGNF
ncbi:MAG: nicotinate phosphoribosyltransferase [Oscillospiraceae bacterium]|nr:nicotinate phosphoribosyltransferase [Oscillospiraceae bacterium]